MNAATMSPFPTPQADLSVQPAPSHPVRGLRPLPTGVDPMSTVWTRPLDPLPGVPDETSAAIPEMMSWGDLPPPFDAAPKSPPSYGSASDFTDDDLRDALEPIMEQAVRKAVYAKENGIDTYLEPMLRATIRRALAEYAPASRPFQPPGVLDRLVWHIRALFTSRTYEEIFFEKTRRFQVEEVFLLDASTLALVSFASCDPARHASVRRVSTTAQRLAARLRDSSGRFHPELQMSAVHRVIARRGRHVILVAIVRGRTNELVLADLEFSLRRIEDHFRDQFEQEGSALLHELQPFLEDCLLIQSPATSAAS